MPTIKFIDHQGQSREVYAENGTSLMDTAVYNGISGIVADCGGACSCATCHVYVDPEWLAKMPKMCDEEQALLEFAIELKENSRLSCQIDVTEDMDGLIVLTPENQY